jgi:hypothetical protein
MSSRLGAGERLDHCHCYVHKTQRARSGSRADPCWFDSDNLQRDQLAAVNTVKEGLGLASRAPHTFWT